MIERTSIIWLTPREELQKLLDTSISFSEVMRKLGYSNIEGNLRTLKQRIKIEEFNTEQLIRNKILNFVNLNKEKTTPIENMLIENSTTDRKTLKNRIIKDKIIEYKCFDCGISDTWNNKPIVLQLEHKNGISNDNRKENLCFLCPNCHSQTKTFAGKNNLLEKTKLDGRSKNNEKTKLLIVEGLNKTKNIKELANILKITRNTIHRYIKKFNLMGHSYNG